MSLVNRIVNTLRFARTLSIFKVFQDYPRFYFAFILAYALLGYAYLLLFPAGIIYGAYQTVLSVMLPFSGEMLLSTLTWLSVTMFFSGITHGLVTIRFEKPDGIVLTPEKARQFFYKLKEIESNIKWPKIDNVVLSRRFELEIIKTPRFGFPFWSETTLIIGYPFMQSLPVEYFDCAVTRKLLQYSKRQNIVYNWLSFLRHTWQQYPAAFKKRALVGDQLSYWFFKIYGNFYHRFALYITQADELYADTLVLHKLNDRDVFKTAETIRLVQMFLNEHFWPKLEALLKKKQLSPGQIKPYDHLAKSTLQILQSNMVNHWLKLLSIETQKQNSAEAPFAKRMEHMGYGKMINPKSDSITAAQFYFGPANTHLTALMNKLWATQVSKKMAHQLKTPRKQVTGEEQQRLTVAF